MANLRDFIQQNSNSVGLVDIVLSTAIDSFLTFQSSFPSGELYYAIFDENTGNREAGLGVFDGIDTITRQTIFASAINSQASVEKIEMSGNCTISCTTNATLIHTLLNDVITNANAITALTATVATNSEDIATLQTITNNANDETISLILALS